ncbi:BTAD domain-containing putative transcriptional regulator [Nocardioides sp. GXQ0305]|uniref:BTAD domain-containing putative transcriptional regulator n=1 Tax=Nocardioides sp. GXQ0305 TaxID=3423912 RepID=UPI003D7CFA5F
MLTVSLLGPVEARLDDLLLDVPAGKTTELLARLALDASVRVRADTLLEELWGGPTGRNTLQSKVSQLRRALRDRSLVAGNADGYLLAVAPEAVDASRAVALAAEAGEARRTGDAAAAEICAREGLALFRGDVLVDAGAWAEVHRARLEEVRLGLLEDLVAARLDLGAGSELIAELESEVTQHPLREGLWASLITALYRAGRQADALAAYARVRRLLVDELGIEPGPELRHLEDQVLQQSVELGEPARRGVAVPGNLPEETGALVGRVEDLSRLQRLVTERRLVTLTGPAGVGKTRLATEVARGVEAAGGVWLVRLDAVDADADLAQVVAEALHVTGGAPALLERLGGASTLLVLDNCEHLVGPVAGFVHQLLAEAPAVRILATSQVPLGVEEEQVHPLEPLPRDESVDLFVLRARQSRRHLSLDARTTTLIEEMCGSLDGLPLAIELAAARVRSMSVPDIARRLDDRFSLLRDPSSQGPERRRALAGAIAWSYELLFPDDQRGLWALSAFAGSAGLDAIEDVLAALGVPSGSVPDTITRLVDRSLVAVDAAANGDVRYRLLDSIRLFAGARLEDAGLAPVVARAHAQWYAETAEWCDEHVRTARQPECVQTVRSERANIDASLTWATAHAPELAARIALGFGWTWVVLGDGTAGASRVRGAMTSSASAAQQLTGALLAGWLEASAGDVTLAQADLDHARSLAGEVGDEVLVADVDRHQAFVAIQQGRAELARSSADASLATYGRLELPWRTAGSLLLGAYGSLMDGDTATATRDAGEALLLLTPLGDGWGLVHANAMLGGIAQAEHRFAEAARALEDAADTSRLLGFPGQAALHRATLARVQMRADDPTAEASFERAIDDAQAVGDGRLAATARLHLARLHRARGHHAAAVALLQENSRWYAAAGGGDYALLTRCVLDAELDDADGLADVLAEARRTGNLEVQVYALDALARLAAQVDDVAAATAHLAEADAIAEGLRHVVDEADRLDAAAARGRWP